MILQRVRVREPVVVMGETGCGKTYLIRYVAEVLFKEYSVYREFIFHSGVEEKDFIEFMHDLIDDANAELERIRQMNQKSRNKAGGASQDETVERPKVYWVFFDEFNTSHLQAFVSEIMHDRVFSLGTDGNSRRDQSTTCRTTSCSWRRATRTSSRRSRRATKTTSSSYTPTRPTR